MKVTMLRTWSISALLLLTLVAGCAQGTRTDAEIAADVQNKINTDPNLPNKTISVNAANGTVTLSGTVGSESERLAAANDAAQVNGVKTVVNNLQVGNAAAGMAPMNPTNTAPGNVNSAPARRTTTPATTTRSSVPAAVPTTQASVTVPSGAEMSVRLNDQISSEEVAAGDTFTATLDAPVYAGNSIAIPANADVQGRVVEVKSAGKFAGRSELFLQLTRVSYNGRNYSISTANWEKYGASRGKNTAAKVGGGAAIGAVIGGIAGGAKGAAIGAGVGAGAGTGAQAITKSEQIVLRPETLLTFTLKQPVTVTAASST
ncbi:MAG: BON domain-containing protein, partial [Terriglobales bacterium]